MDGGYVMGLVRMEGRLVYYGFLLHPVYKYLPHPLSSFFLNIYKFVGIKNLNGINPHTPYHPHPVPLPIYYIYIRCFMGIT